MKVKMYFVIRVVLIVLVICPPFTSAQTLKPIKLLKPQTDIGKPLMQVLKDRKSSRAFSPEKLPLQVLSNLLWAAFGVNRQDSGKRTAPSAVNWQEVDIYVAMAEGLYLYNAKTHILEQILTEDIRAATGKQDFVGKVPVNLIYVADFSKISRETEKEKIFYSAVDTGFIGQNVYLFCTSEGLATVIRGLVDKPALAKVMKLQPNQRVILSQSVGYPQN